MTTRTGRFFLLAKNSKGLEAAAAALRGRQKPSLPEKAAYAPATQILSQNETGRAFLFAAFAL